MSCGWLKVKDKILLKKNVHRYNNKSDAHSGLIHPHIKMPLCDNDLILILHVTKSVETQQTRNAMKTSLLHQEQRRDIVLKQQRHHHCNACLYSVESGKSLHIMITSTII